MNIFRHARPGLISVTLLLVACGQSEGTLGKIPGDNSPAIAKVNGVPITEQQIRMASSRHLMMFNQNADEKDPKKEALKDVIDNEILLQAAIKEGYHRKESVSRQILREYLNAKLKEKFDIKDEEYQAYYDKHRDELDRIRAAHILIRPAKPGDAASEKAAQKKAEEVLKQARAGMKFADLAKKYSQDVSSATRGGDLRSLKRTDIAKPFTDAAFALEKPGDLSGVVKTEFGYHIIQLKEKMTGIEPARHIIRENLIQERKGQAKEEIVADLRKKTKVNVDEAALEKLDILKGPKAP